MTKALLPDAHSLSGREAGGNLPEWERGSLYYDVFMVAGAPNIVMNYVKELLMKSEQVR
jgi:hypothetical protein